MGNCMANNRVVSRELDDDDDCRLPFMEEKKGAGRDQEGTAEDEEKKRKTEKKVRFKLEYDDSEGYRGEKCRDLRNGKRTMRRVKVVVKKEELRQILKYAKLGGASEDDFELVRKWRRKGL